MKYPYIVIHNGKWYNAGEEVPENNNSGASLIIARQPLIACLHLIYRLLPQNKV